MHVYCSKSHKNEGSHRFCINCGEPLPLPPEQIISNRYKILRLLGQGGFGRTYLAEDIHQQQKIVLKEFAPLMDKASELQKASELFNREVMVLQQLNHHQIPKFHAAVREKIGNKDFFFLVQDYIDGDTYAQLLENRQNRKQTFTEDEVKRLLQQLLPVLAYMHSQKVVHRDITPDNLMWRRGDNQPVLIDFGGVKQLPAIEGFWATQMGVNRTLLGKKGYAPEEQLRQGQSYPNSDLYSLAVCMLVLLMGKEPQQLYDSYEGNWRWGKDIKVSPQLENVLKKMLLHKPSDRYQDADEVLKDLFPSTSPVIQQNNNQPTLITQQIQKGQPAQPAQPASQAQAVQSAPQGNPYMSRLRTMMASPGSKRPNSQPRKITQIVVNSNSLIPVWLRPFAWSLLGTSAVVLVGAGSWALVNGVVKAVQGFSLPKLPEISAPKNPGSPTASSGENDRINKILARRQKLEISEIFFNNIVNDTFYTKYPDAKGRNLTNSPEDKRLREEWHKIADNFLNKIEQAKLSSAARKRLGKYGASDYQRWETKAKEGKLGNYTIKQINKETNGKFDNLFPGIRQGRLKQETYGQIWYALAGDKIDKIQSGN
jgi:serine/threonine protein kinase